MARKQVKRFEVSHVHVGSVAEAWQVAGSYFPGDYEKDDRASACAGYPIYRSPSDWALYVCDLCTRLEVNLSNGDTVNIWIDDDEPAAAPAAVSDGDGLQAAAVPSPVQSSAAAGATPAEGSQSGAAAPGADAPAVLAATDPRPASVLISDGLEDGERITVELISCETGELRKYETLRAFLDEWAWWHSGGRCIMNDDKIAAALRGILDVGHGARVSLGLAGFEIVFTFYRWPGYDRFMRPVREVA